MSDIISLKSSKSSSPISLSIGNNITSNPNTVANFFNDYFCSIADTIRAKIPYSHKNFKHFLSNPNPNSFFIHPVSSTEVASCISTLPENKANGPYSFPNKILKLLNPDLSITIQKLLNLSFQTGCFPSLLKISMVTPIFKKGSSLEVSNYRPISLLSNIEKIFEKLMYSRLISFLENYKILYCQQFGFRKGFSTTHALASIIERISQYLDKGQFACGVFVDLKKAFDTVDHSILLENSLTMGYVA